MGIPSMPRRFVSISFCAWFLAVFIPLRLLLTIALPICWVFGLAVLVYQHDYFTWISSILNAPKVYWLVPIMSLSILVGLGLDYDLFLFLRVQEYREAGFTTEAAMRKGLYRTGSVITTAGLIMVRTKQKPCLPRS